MSESLENCMNDTMKHILLSFNNQYLSIVLGIILTAIIQSSSAMTIMLISCLNSHLISLESAIWILMGANIGTTITGQILTLDIGIIAPLLAIVGVILVLTRYQTVGEVLLGLGLLFIGLDFLQIGLGNINIDIFFKVNHPFIMVVYGFILTTIIQSSSASIGILQSLVIKNIIPFSKAVYMIFGFNIGSTMTGILTSIISNNDAKRLALFHLLMNTIGTAVFYLLCTYTSFVSFFKTIVSSPLQQVACMHTLFNVITTLFILLIDKYLIKIVYLIFPEQYVIANPQEDC